MNKLAFLLLVLLCVPMAWAFDAHKNFAVSTVVVPPVPATSGTTLTVARGQGSRFPIPPFNVVICPINAAPTPVNAEIVRVIAVRGDTLVVIRGEEGTALRTSWSVIPSRRQLPPSHLTDLEDGKLDTLDGNTTLVAPSIETSALRLAGAEAGDMLLSMGTLPNSVT